MGNKRLGISLIANIISMVVSLGVSFLLTPYLISTLGKEAYSFFPLANNFVSYMTIITMALNSMASRYITVSLAGKQVQKAHTYFSTVFFSNVLMSIALILPMTVIVVFIEQFLDVPNTLAIDVKILFALIFIAMIINLVFSVFGVATFAKERMDLYALQSIGQSLIKAILYVVLFLIFPPSICIMGVVTIVIALFNGSIQYAFTRKLMPDYRIRLTEFDGSAVKELVGSGIWNSINNLGTSLLQSMALLLANSLIGVVASGDLAIVQTLPNLMTTVICAVYGVLLPRIANVYASGSKENIVKTVLQSQKILGIISSVPVVIIILFGKSFFQLWVPEENAGYLQGLSILTILPLLIHSSMWTVYGLNVMNNKLKKPAILFLLTGILNVVITVIVIDFTQLDVYVIPLVSGILNIIYYLFFIPSYAAKQMNFSKFVFYPHIIKTVLFSVVLIGIGMSVVSRLQISNWFQFFIYAGIAEVIGILIYVMIVFSKEEKQQLINLIKMKVMRRK